MRDQRYRWRYHSASKKINGVLDGTWQDQQVYDAGERTDIIKTTKVDGRYVMPTYYRGYFSTTQVQGGAEKRKRHLWPFTGTWDTIEINCTGARTDVYPTWGIQGGVPIMPNSVIQAARGNLRSAIRNGAWDAASFAAEIDETLAFLMHPMRTLLSLLSKKSGWKHMADWWTTYNFAVKPLMSDIYSILETIEMDIEAASHRKPFRARVVEMDPDYGPPKASQIAFGYRGEVSGKAIRGYEISAFYKVTNPALYQLEMFGLTNPLTLIWERVYLSFVIDWFFNVQSFLEGLVPPLGLSFSHGYELAFLRNEFTVRYHLGPLPSATELLLIDEPCTVQVMTKAFSRVVLNTTPVPMPYATGFRNIKQVVSTAALIVQQLSR